MTGPGGALFDNEDMAAGYAEPEQAAPSAGVVDVGEVLPELADAETVAEVVAPTRAIETEIGAPLLRTEGLTVRFGGLTALDDVTFEIRRGEILGLIGPNGAGKTTCFNAITGVYRPSAGRVFFDGRPLTKTKRNEITRLGIARTFQNIRLFGEMTALENVVVGTDAPPPNNGAGGQIRDRGARGGGQRPPATNPGGGAPSSGPGGIGESNTTPSSAAWRCWSSSA